VGGSRVFERHAAPARQLGWCIHIPFHGRVRRRRSLGPQAFEGLSKADFAQASRQQPRSPWKVRYFLDTEFTSFEACQLISVAVVSEVGHEFYAERSDFERSLCSDFVHREVLPQLNLIPDRSMPLEQVHAELRAWFAAVPLKPRPVLCYDFEGDFTLIGHLLPEGWRAENVSSKLDQARLTEYVSEHGHAHHALYDARANAYAFR